MEIGRSYTRPRHANHRVGSQAAAALVALSAIFGIMVAGYTSGLNRITLVLDGQPRSIQTNQTTVEGALRDAGVSLYPEDRLQPATDSPLTTNATIQIDRARPVSILVDGQSVHVRTHAATLVELLAEHRITLYPNDALSIDGDPAVTQSILAGAPTTPHTVTVRRAVPFTVQFDDGTSQALRTARSTIGEALAEAGIQVYLADRLRPGLSTRVTSGGSVFVERSIPISVQVDGQTLRTRTHRERVADVLAELGVALQGQDYVQPPLDTPIAPDLSLRVTRVSESFLIEQEPVAFESQVLPNPDMEIDTQQLVQPGESGVLQKRIRIRFEDGQEVARVIEDRTLIRAPQPKITHYGTKIIVRALETPDGPREYWRHFHALASSYSAATAGVPKSNPHYGKTALGWTMRKGIVAVDPKIIPFRTEIYVSGYGVGVAADTGGAIIGKHIDLGYDDDNLVIWYRWVDVYLLTPVPSADKIQYILPNWPIERR